MSSQLPPTIEPQAAARWAQQLPMESAWLHEEVARRMDERLGWIVRQPDNWVHWDPLRGGLQAQSLLTRRYPQATCYVHQTTEAQMGAVRKHWEKAWWRPARWTGPTVRFEPPKQPVQMLWANMAIHMAQDPMELIRKWHQAIAVDGFLMFSCLGPDTLRELRQLYSRLGWPAPAHEFTDMHDWGDMLVRAGFAEPVMDMERITLTFSSPAKLLDELRGLGRNLHRDRFGGLRGRQWLARLHSAIGRELVSSEEPQRLQLTFEVVYGHAFKPAPSLSVAGESSISLQQMRETLSAGKARGGVPR